MAGGQDGGGTEYKSGSHEKVKGQCHGNCLGFFCALGRSC